MDEEEYQRRKELGRKRYLFKLKMEEVKKLQLFSTIKKYRLDYLMNFICILSILLSVAFIYSTNAETQIKRGVIKDKYIQKYKHKNSRFGRNSINYPRRDSTFLYYAKLKINRQVFEVRPLFYSKVKIGDTLLVSVTPIFNDIQQIIAIDHPYQKISEPYDRPSSFYMFALFIPVISLLVPKASNAYFTIRFGGSAWAFLIVVFFLFENNRLLNIFSL
jgi:hypothetical protein